MVVGKHVAGNLYGVKMLEPREALEVMLEASRRANAKVYDYKLYEFDDGYSILILVLESHLSLHTWYAYDFATLDIYTCGEHTDPEVAFQYVVDAFKPVRVEKWYRDRSSGRE